MPLERQALQLTLWGAQALTYLDYEVGVGKINVPEAWVKAIRDYRSPKTKKGLRPFLGTTAYYRRFVSDYAGRADPLYAALQKVATNTIVWNDVMLNAFSSLISSLCSDNVLWHTNASYQGLWAVLSAERDGVQRPLSYFIMRLLPPKKNYAVTELECLAIYNTYRTSVKKS